MKHPVTKFQQIRIEPGRRILVVSDIHGHLSYLRKGLEKAAFTEDDILIVVGDIVEKGPDSLGVLRYVMELCERGNVIPLIGNVDTMRMKLIDELSEENADGFYRYILGQRAWWGTSFYDELAQECGYIIRSPEDMLLSKNTIITHFQREFDFLAELPTVVETQNYIFVHGGLPKKRLADNRDKGVFELTKYNRFMTETKHIFDKYLVVGHWPVCLYGQDRQQYNPIINREKHIISIDGGCGTESAGQLNVLIIPDIDSGVENIFYMGVDEIPCVRALDSQEERAGSVYISWQSRAIKILERGEEFSYIEHIDSGQKLYIPNTYIRKDNECRDYTDYMLPVKEGDTLGLITRTAKGCIVKKDGKIGWYCGAYEAVPD